VPRISEFFGIVVTMYYNDYAPPHFHARYAEHEVTIVIESLEVLDGALPRRALALVREWAAIHHGDLVAAWATARMGEPLPRIAALE
jgi:hypothetical protein